MEKSIKDGCVCDVFVMSVMCAYWQVSQRVPARVRSEYSRQPQHHAGTRAKHDVSEATA